MFKNVLYTLLLLTTGARFLNMAYLLATGSTDLPVPVLLVSAAMIAYGIILLVKKYTGMIRLKQFMAFYVVQTVMITFNLTYMALFYPLKVSLPDALMLGTFLDILVNCGVVYFCVKEIRSAHTTLIYSSGTGA